MGVFAVLARLRFLRGSALDPFGRSDERRVERQLIDDYERDMEAVLTDFDAVELSAAAALADLPQQIRGVGHVKEASLDLERKLRQHFLDHAQQMRLGDRLHAGQPPATA